MEKLLQALNDTGFWVHINAGRSEAGQMIPGGCTVMIMTAKHMQFGLHSERWEGYAGTVKEALDAACFQLQQHMRPAYEGYLTLAEAFGWEV